MGMELELGTLLVIQLLGTTLFARFEIETGVARKLMKWFLLHVTTLILFFIIGHYSLLLPAFILILGTSVHLSFCKKNGIDPLRATPRKKYYELRKWKWEE